MTDIDYGDCIHARYGCTFETDLYDACDERDGLWTCFQKLYVRGPQPFPGNWDDDVKSAIKARDVTALMKAMEVEP